MFARIINLDSRPDRWKLMQAYVDQSKHRIERFSAIQLKDDPTALLSYRAKADYQRERVQHEAIQGKGAIGCAVSHFLVWQEFLHSDSLYCLVLEDDLHPRYAAQLDGAIDEFLQSNLWDIGLLGWCGSLPSKRADGTLIPFPESRGFVGAQAYLLTRHAAEILVNHTFPLEMQIDFLLQSIAHDHCLRIKATSYPRIRQTFTGFSDVFTFCLLCEPLYVYILITISIALNIGLLYKLRRTLL